MKMINQLLKFSDELYKKSLQDDLIKKNEYESLCTFFTELLNEMKNEFFMNKVNITKLIFLSSNEINLEHET